MTLYWEAVGFGIIAAASIALGAMGFTLQFGLTNVLNIGYGAIMSLGGIVAYVSHSAGVSIWLGLLLGGLSASALTLIVAKTVLAVYPRRGAALFEMAMITFGVALIIEYAIAAITRNNTYPLNIPLEHAMLARAAALHESAADTRHRRVRCVRCPRSLLAPDPAGCRAARDGRRPGPRPCFWNRDESNRHSGMVTEWVSVRARRRSLHGQHLDDQRFHRRRLFRS